MESQPQNPEFRNNPENFHPCISSKARGLNFGLSLRLHPYFKYATSKGSVESMHIATLQCDATNTKISCNGKNVLPLVIPWELPHLPSSD